MKQNVESIKMLLLRGYSLEEINKMLGFSENNMYRSMKNDIEYFNDVKFVKEG